MSVTEITRHVWNNWPEEWAEERVERPDILRLIFQVTLLYYKSIRDDFLNASFVFMAACVSYSIFCINKYKTFFMEAQSGNFF